MAKRAKRASRPNPRVERNLPNFITQENVIELNHFKTPRKKRVDIIPRNLAQEQYVDALHDEDQFVVFAIGPAGTGKTLLATQYAIKALREGLYDKIVITRPAVCVDEEHGFLPGTIVQKMEPWMLPILDVFREHYHPREIAKMIEDGIIEISPLAFMRGRAEPLDSMIPTPTGYKRMGEITVGDLVLGADGQPTKVTGVFPQGKKQVFKMGFDDGSSVLCSEDHLWVSRTLSEKRHRKQFSVKTAGEIRNSLKNRHGAKNHEVPVITAPAMFERQPVSVDPYLLGCLLGDGTLSGTIRFTTADTEMAERVGSLLPKDMFLKKYDSCRCPYSYAVSKNGRGGNNQLKTALRELGVFDKTAVNKFVPSRYKWNDSVVRIGVLQGLMDTDGSIFVHRSGKTRVQFYSISPQLAKDVKWIAESLGGVARLRKRTFRADTSFGHNHDGWIVDLVLPAAINPFRLSRKASLFNPVRLKRLITEVTEAGEQECQCIAVEARDKLYLSNNFIVTHNTHKAAFVIADEMQNSRPSQMKMVLTRLGDGSRMVVTGDLQQHDGGYEQNGLRDFLSRFKRSEHMTICEFDASHIERHPVIEEVLRLYGEA